MFGRLRAWVAARRDVRYDDSFFSEQWFRGWDTLKEVLHGLIASEPQWRSIVDYGCGPGIMIDLMNDRGYDYVGCDVSAEARALYLERYGKYPERYVASLAEVAGRRFDLLISFDVLEHMTDEQVRRLLAEVRHIPALLFNVSRVRGIPGHINIKRDTAWIRLFEECGWTLDEPGTRRLRDTYLKLRPGGGDLWHKNMFLLRRAGAEA